MRSNELGKWLLGAVISLSLGGGCAHGPKPVLLGNPAEVWACPEGHESITEDCDRIYAAPGYVPHPGVKGGLDKEVIARIVRRHQEEIKWCYERTLQKRRDACGRYTVRFFIGAAGEVVAATVVESAGEEEIENCLVARVKRWRFPRPKGGGVVRVDYPWLFKPSNSTAAPPEFDYEACKR